MTFDDLPRDLVTMVDAAVRVLPPTPDELRRITRTGDARRRRRTAAVVLAAVAGVVAAGAVMPPWLDGRSMAPTGPQPGASTAPAGPTVTTTHLSGVQAQRMLVSSSAGYFESPPARPVHRENFDTATPDGTVVVFAEDAELRADDALVPFRFAGGGQVRRVVPAPDDGAAVLVERTVPAGPNCFGTTELRLEIYAADGTRKLSRQVGGECDAAELIGVDYFRAFLRRGNAVTAYALADGSETKVADAALDLGFTATPKAAGLVAQLDQGRLLFSDATSCQDRPRIVVYDVPTGRTKTVVPQVPCDRAAVVRLSPDGQLFAIAYRQEGRLVIDMIDVESGRSRHRVQVGDTGRPAAVAWHSNTAVRLAWYRPPEAGKVLLDEVLQLAVAVAP
ncbi:hypothetical protein Daura_19250 [Dactylosporangium aurantiacum]|uniref:Uncharacterized protein n=1 Tax=Dactylosporangium aurantiacum TaxID=35754 RepID=A0A9Q9IN89_9ACTN|nr:hypothetical protein [Dactylosporangium aurantiacum]MDG6109889.1 hypothetical protein [Dactylosporangium aurantiacum]UWZ58113.1 hypothetical protein Daura_19250 [Dactylosporangium aurantiacum]